MCIRDSWNSVLPDGRISDTGMNSLNHYAYGSIAEWMYRTMCGINPSEEAPGFRRIVLRPVPDARLSFAKEMCIRDRADETGAVHATQEELANLAGLSRVTVSRALARMEREGLVKRGYGSLVLRRRPPKQGRHA